MTFAAEPDYVASVRQALLARNLGSGDLTNDVLAAVSAKRPGNFFVEDLRIRTTSAGTVEFEPLNRSCDN